MKCPKCKSENIQVITKTEGKIKKRGLVSTLIWILLAICTCGIILIIPILTGGSKGKIKTKTAFVCLNCGKEFHK